MYEVGYGLYDIENVLELEKSEQPITNKELLEYKEFLKTGKNSPNSFWIKD